MLSDVNLQSTTSPSFLPPKTAVDARLVVRNSLNEVIQSWDVVQSKCTIGKANSCTIQCDLEGIADIHALLVVGSRQTFVRALAPGLVHAGAPVNEVLLDSPDDEFSIAGHCFALVRDIRKKGIPSPQQSGGLKFSLTTQPSVTPAKPARQPVQVAESIEQQTKWMTDLIQSAVGPLEHQIQDLSSPIAELQRESRRQKQLRRKRSAARKKRLEEENAKQEQAKEEDRTERDEFNREIETIVSKHAANVDALSERINDVSHQLSAIERIVSQEASEDNNAVDPSHETQVQQAAIEQLQAGIVTVSAVLSDLQDKQAAQNADNEQWREDVREQLNAINVSIEQVSSSQEIDPELRQTLARLEQQQMDAQSDVNTWRDGVTQQLDALQQQVEAKEASADTLPEQVNLAVEEIRNQNSATLAEISAWKLDLLEELQSLKSDLEQRAVIGDRPAADEPNASLNTQPLEQAASVGSVEPAPVEDAITPVADPGFPPAELEPGITPEDAGVSQIEATESHSPSEGWPAFDLSSPVENALLSTHEPLVDGGVAGDPIDVPQAGAESFEQTPELSNESEELDTATPVWDMPIQAEAQPEIQDVSWPQFNIEASEEHVAAQELVSGEPNSQGHETADSQSPPQAVVETPLTLAQLEAEERARAELQEQQDAVEVEPAAFVFEQQTYDPSQFLDLPEELATQTPAESTGNEFAVEGFAYGDFVVSTDEEINSVIPESAEPSAEDSFQEQPFSAVVEGEYSELEQSNLDQLNLAQPAALEELSQALNDSLEQASPKDPIEESRPAEVEPAVDDFAFGGQTFGASDADEPANGFAHHASADAESGNPVEEEFFGLTQLPAEPLSNLQENRELQENQPEGLTGDSQSPFSGETFVQGEDTGEQSFRSDVGAIEDSVGQDQAEGGLPSWWTEEQTEDSQQQAAGLLDVNPDATQDSFAAAREPNQQIDELPQDIEQSTQPAAPDLFGFGNSQSDADQHGDLAQELLQRQKQLDEQQFANDQVSEDHFTSGQFTSEQANEQSDEIGSLGFVPPDERDEQVEPEEQEFFGLTNGLASEGLASNLEATEQAQPEPVISEYQSQPDFNASPQNAGGDVSGAAADDEAGDDSVEDYMQKLLARMRGEEVSDAPTPSPQPSAPASSQSLSSEPENESSALDSSGPATVTHASEETEPFDLDQYVPVATAPEKSRNLDAMRDLANSSARTAIQKSTTQRVFTTAVMKLAIASISLTVAAVLLVINGLSMNIGLIATGAAFLLGIFWGYDGAVTLKPLLKK